MGSTTSFVTIGGAENHVKAKAQTDLRDGDHCHVVGGTHAGKSGTVTDIKTSKTGHVTITVVQKSGERFKTLAKNVVVRKRRSPR
jgi:ribosomal protein S4E